MTDALHHHVMAAQMLRDAKTIRDEFPEICTDPTLKALAEQKVNEAQWRDMQQGRLRTALDVARGVGNEIRTALGGARHEAQPAQRVPVTPARTHEEIQTEHRRKAVEDMMRRRHQL